MAHRISGSNKPGGRPGLIQLDHHLFYSGDTLRLRVVLPHSLTGYWNGEADGYLVIFDPSGVVNAYKLNIDTDEPSLLIDYPADLIATGDYQIVLVLTVSGGDPTNIADWYHGIEGLVSSAKFRINRNSLDSEDLDRDGEFDDDLDEDGYLDEETDSDVDDNAEDNDQEMDEGMDGDSEMGEEPMEVEVNVDIKPGSNHNPINPRSHGNIPVAILSIKNEFDATEVDPSTVRVRFGPTNEAASIAHRGHIEDVNDDGLDDLLVHIKTQAIGIGCGDGDSVELSVSGKTRDGHIIIHGSDSIIIVGC